MVFTTPMVVLRGSMTMVVVEGSLVVAPMVVVAVANGSKQ